MDDCAFDTYDREHTVKLAILLRSLPKITNLILNHRARAFVLDKDIGEDLRKTSMSIVMPQHRFTSICSMSCDSFTSVYMAEIKEYY